MQAVRLIMLVIFASMGANGALIQENFEGATPGQGLPPTWRSIWMPAGAAEIVEDTAGNNVLQLTGTTRGGAVWENTYGFFVENFTMQVSLSPLTGTGGIVIGQCEGGNYANHSYFVQLLPGSANDFRVVLAQDHGGAISLLGSYPQAFPLRQWYDLMLVSTASTLQVWFRPRSPLPWNIADKLFEVAHDHLHPGHKAHSEGMAGCWTERNGVIQFDNIILRGNPFPAPVQRTDDFEIPYVSAANWTSHGAVTSFTSVAGKAEVVAGKGVGRIAVDAPRKYFTHLFTMRSSMMVYKTFNGGLFWGWNGGTSGYDLNIIARPARRGPGTVSVELIENQGPTAVVFGTYSAPMVAGLYTAEVVADYSGYSVYFWNGKADRKPANASPIFTATPGFGRAFPRWVNSGSIGLRINAFGKNKTGYFDDFSFYGIQAPHGIQVPLRPELKPLTERWPVRPQFEDFHIYEVPLLIPKIPEDWDPCPTPGPRPPLHPYVLLR